jgi:hypothetical protein
VAFVVHIYEQKTPTGFSVPTSELQGKEAISILAQSLLKSLSAPKVDILIATVRGRFDQPES